MKISMTVNGPVVGSDVTEIVDIEEYFGVSPDEEDLEETLNQCVADWADNIYSYGWCYADDDEETTDA